MPRAKKDALQEALKLQAERVLDDLARAPEWPRRTSMLWPDENSGPWLVTLAWAIVDAELVPIGIEIRSYRILGDGDEVKGLPLDPREARALTTEALRKIQLRVLKAVGVEQLGWADIDRANRLADVVESVPTLRERLLEPLADVRSDLAARSSKAASAAPGRRLDREHYARVAATYRAALGNEPTLTIAETFGTSRSTAARWVMECRRLELLGPTTRGRKGEHQPEQKRRGKGER